MQTNVEKYCVEKTYGLIGKKWCINIICDIFSGKKRFTDFLESNPGLSTKMLAERLEQMQKDGLLRKKYNQLTSGHDYVLTDRGIKTEKILLEMSEFSMNLFREKQ